MRPRRARRRWWAGAPQRVCAGALVLLVLLTGCMVPIPTVQPLTVIDPVEEVQTLDLGIDMGAGEASLDLTGLRLSGLSVTSGSTDLVLAFGAPNPEPLGRLQLTAGAGKVTATGLGHANFDQLAVLGGAGAVDLDFSGAFHRSAMADIKAGAGRVTVHVPSGIGVRVTLGGVSLGNVDVTGFSKQADDVYVNDAYGQSPLTLTIKITTGVGSVSLISE